MSENKYPLVLQSLDKNLGSNTVEAYAHAAELAPELGGIAVIAGPVTGKFVASKLGLEGSYVMLSNDPATYKTAINSGVANKRLGEFSKFFRERGIAPGVNELITSVLLHELGHGDDFNNYIDRANGDTASAFELSKKVRRSELATLPLKAATSRAIEAWENNTQGYRDQMQDRGFTDEKWADLLDANIAAYSQLSCEQVADRFALGVLATIHT